MTKGFMQFSLAAAGSVAVLSASLTFAADVKLPDTLTWTAYDLGSSGYNQSVAIGKAVMDAYGTTLRVVPAKNDVSRLAPVRRGQVQFANSGSDVFYAVEGVFGYADPDWGPQPLRMVSSAGSDNCLAMGTAADANIRTPADLKGKRVAWVRGAPSLQTNVTAFMAFGGVTWNDVEKVEMPGFGPAWQALMNGQVDAMSAFTTGGIVEQAAASPRGLFWLPLPFDDKAGWDRLNKVAPHFNKTKAIQGAAGVSKEHPLPCAGFPYPILVAYPDQKADLVYNMTKAISAQVPNFAKAEPTAGGWADDHQTMEWVLPFHEGAIKFWQEKGRWNAEAQARTDTLLKRQQILADAWADLKKKGDAAVKAEWMKVRAAALTEAGMEPVWTE